MSKTVLLSGGNGYIGGAVGLRLLRLGWNPIVLDNFSTSKRGAHQHLHCIDVDLRDQDATESAFQLVGPAAAVIHFAAKALVPESRHDVHGYFDNNLRATTNVAEACVKSGISSIIHSSSCAVYGTPPSTPIKETTPFGPETPYGETKVMAETILNAYARYKNLRILHLRYFNPAGAVSKENWGEQHEPETHLIPRVLISAKDKLPVNVFGTDYPTPDGTCIRDYIHIDDLAEAHTRALEYLGHKQTGFSEALNVGVGKGYSVLEVIKTAEKVLKTDIQISRESRRLGDPACLFADVSLMKERFHWTPQKNLFDMIQDDWNWRTKKNLTEHHGTTSQSERMEQV